jgi:thiol-disulfide isomerase/thioredoxin
MASRLTLKDMQEVAAHYSGKCLSKEYINVNTPLEWMCAKGHRWERDYDTVRQGGWCVQCAIAKRKEDRLEQIKQIAMDRGGKCLSKEYIQSKSKLEFECDKGHRWKALPNNITQGSWCLKCARQRMGEEQRDSIVTFYKIAAEHGGKCLSKEYLGGPNKIEFECEHGHRWKTLGISVKIGHWCPDCRYINNGLKRRDPIDVFNKIAKDKGGKCLSTEYINRDVPLKFECAEGHTWKTSGNLIKKGTWCPKCFNKKRGASQRDSIKTFQEIAKKHGGKCLSTKYINSNTRLEFECAKGHRWYTKAITIKHQGSWCPGCYSTTRGESLRDSIETYHRIAAEKGGKCISTEYKNKDSRLTFECAKGHIWQTVAQGVKNGTWCRVCSYIARAEAYKDVIETFQKIAKQHGGKCLSKEYVLWNSKLEFQCAKGHTWLALPKMIKQGYWCKQCANKPKNPNQNTPISLFIVVR